MKTLTSSERRAINETLPDGLHVSIYGYLRIHCGRFRRWYAHRAYMQTLINRPLRADEHVHHDCRNPLCWPPSEFHLVLMDAALHNASNGRRR